MSSNYLSRLWPREEESAPPKRISTPAGLRLSVILDKGELGSSLAAPPHSPKRPRLVLPEESYSVTVTHEVDVQSTKRFPDKTRNPSPSPPYSQSLYSEKSKSVLTDERPTERPQPAARQWIRRRMFAILGVAFAVLLTLIIGLAVGLSKKHHKALESTSSGTSTHATSAQQTIVTTSVPLPTNFPLGTYSIPTFLDSVLTNCTGDPGVWTCPPGIAYESDTLSSLEMFNFAITAGAAAGSYQIAPAGANDALGPSGSSFLPVPLTVVNPGQASENYRFQTTVTRTNSAALNGSATGGDTCAFPGTTFQGWLYTRAARSYPAAGQTLPGPAAFGMWPFEARVEMVVGGVVEPECYQGSGTTGMRLALGAAPQDAGSLCSCLYRNSNLQ